MNNHLIPTPIVDKNGKHTTVFKKDMKSGTATASLPAPLGLSSHSNGAPKQVELNTDEMDAAFSAAPTYRKSAVVTARLSKAGEALVTTLANGTVETSRTLESDQYIVTNPGGEEYAIAPEKFASRYEDIGDGNYRAIGKAKIIPNDTGGDVDIMAPWGELQHGKSDCVFASGVDEDGNPTTDRYIIGGEEFLETYELFNAKDQRLP